MYEDRFGRAFIIRAAGRSAEEILGLLRRRINLDPVNEMFEVYFELREITEYRVRALVDP